MHPTHRVITSSDTKRFEKIYAQTYARLYGFVNHYVKDQQAVKDILQDCYIRLWEKMEVIKDDEKILPMLRTWAIHTTSNSLRKNARDKERAYAWQENNEKTCVADENLFRNETMKQYYRVVSELPLQQRLVFTLTREEGLSQRETADKLQISINTVKRHLSEALQTLRTKIPKKTLTGILMIAALQSGNLH